MRWPLALTIGWLVLYYRVDYLGPWYNYVTVRSTPIHYTTLEVPMQIVAEGIGGLVLLTILALGLKRLADYINSKSYDTGPKRGESK